MFYPPRTDPPRFFDKGNKGTISLEDWSPEAAELVFGFKEHLATKYGSVKDGWVKCLDFCWH